MIVYTNDPENSTRNLYSWKTLFNKVTGYKIAHKSVASCIQMKTDLERNQWNHCETVLHNDLRETLRS